MAIVNGIFIILATLTSAAYGQILFDHASALRVSNLPDFVGFSYSRASQNPPSQRFIQFMNENLNVNANFLSSYGSFRVSRAGIYFFTYSFLTKKNEAAIVALRLNGDTVVSALSEENGHSPVSQSTVINLRSGDVVQLEVLQGQVYETSSADFAYTSFSGWMLSSLVPVPAAGDTVRKDGPGFSDRVDRVDRLDYDDVSDCCYCCRPKPPQRPPDYRPPPSYLPPHPTLPPRTKPPYIYTTQPPTPTLRPPYGREDEECCDSVLVSAGSGHTLQVQSEKFGVYRLLRVNADDRRAVFKHCENEVFIYYYRAPSGWHGWIIGPVAAAGRGGIISQTDSICVEKDVSRNWQYYDDFEFRFDESISVTCFGEDPASRKTKADGADHLHYHRHEHFHHSKDIAGRQASLEPPGPAYNINSNPDFVEATFVFPNRNDTPAIIPPIGPAPLDPILPQVLDVAGRDGGNGDVVRRRGEAHDDVVYV